MEQVRLGNAGLKVSELCLGMMSFGDSSVWQKWILPADSATTFVGAAADAGITFFDTADAYSFGASEEATGKALREVFSRREEYVVGTKVFMKVGDAPNDRGLSRGHILDSVDKSLRRLGLDHIDLYQIHRWDPETPIEETMQALDDCVRAGKVRYIGASSMYAWQFATAQHVAARNGWTQFVTMQPHLNLLYREEEREMLPYCEATGVGVLPWSPLARGRLTRPPSRADETDRGQLDERTPYHYEGAPDAIVEAVGRIAEARGVKMAQVALAWVLSKRAVTAPVIGATRIEHLQDAAGATELTLSQDEIDELEANYLPLPVRSH